MSGILRGARRQVNAIETSDRILELGLKGFPSDSSCRKTPAGSFVVMPKGTHHFAWTKGETVLHVYAFGPWGLTYVNPGDDPRTKR